MACGMPEGDGFHSLERGVGETRETYAERLYEVVDAYRDAHKYDALPLDEYRYEADEDRPGWDVPDPRLVEVGVVEHCGVGDGTFVADDGVFVEEDE